MFHDHREIRGYEQCVPAGGRAWRGRVSDVAVSERAVKGGGARKLCACGVAGWVTVLEANRGSRGSRAGGPAPFQTLYTTQTANGGARRARFLSSPAESRESREDENDDGNGPALVAVAGEDGFVVARDAEDGEVAARFAIRADREVPAHVWSLSGFASKDDRSSQFLVAGTADGDVACWKVPARLFRREATRDG